MVDVDDPRPIGHLLQFSALALLILAITLVANAHITSGLVSLSVGILVGLGWFALRFGQLARVRAGARFGSLAIALLGLSAISGWLPQLLFWNLLVPLLLFLLWPIRYAAILSLGFFAAALVLTGTMAPQLGPLRHQLVPSLLLVTLLGGLFGYLREVKARQLAPLRRTDSLTLASTQEHLQADLYTEIQRSEREGTALAVVHLALDPTDHPLPQADRDALLRHLGKLLHQQLRAFDGYYRIDQSGFVLILPGTGTAGATTQAEKLRVAGARLMESLAVPRTLSAGVTAVNVGDTASTLTDRAGEALQRAQSRGGNRTQSWAGAPDSASEGSSL